MANSKLKCKQCGTYRSAEITVKHPAGRFCSDTDCVLDYIKTTQERDRAARARKARKAKGENDKARRSQHRADKERVKPLTKLRSEAQAVVNRYVRLRDYSLGCVSCDKPPTWWGQWHASHFHPTGRSSGLRFNLWNIHKSCSQCNTHLSGNLRSYEPELINRIGIDKFNFLDANSNTPTKYSPEYLRKVKRVFAKKCRHIKKRNDRMCGESFINTGYP